MRAAREGASIKELYDIAHSDWELTDKGLEQLVFPAAFGECPRSTSTFYKAVEWEPGLSEIFTYASYR